MKLRTLIPALALALSLVALGASPAVAAEKSPKKFCKKAGEANSKCLDLAEDARDEARDAKKSDRKKKGNKKAKGAAGKFCKANGAGPGSKAFKKCEKKAEKAARKGGGGGNGGGGNGTPQCADSRDNDGDGQIDLADPDCTSATDPSEGDVYIPPGEPTNPTP